MAALYFFLKRTLPYPMCDSKIYLLADSGASKTDWVILQSDNVVHQFQTMGISPLFQTEEEIAVMVRADVLPQTAGHDIHKVRFYGSGCIPEKVDIVKRAMRESFDTDDVEIYSDLVAAAHALCANEAGIVAILGTGSNSCEWNGQIITNHVSPLGYVLGDEGSGAHMGRLLIGDALKGQLTEGLKEKLLEQYDMTTADIIDSVYRKPFPSRFLASFTPFIVQNIDDPTIADIVKRSFTEFFQRNIMHYDIKVKKINFVGSIAFHFSESLIWVANELGLEVGKIEKSPLGGVIEYYNQEH